MPRLASVARPRPLERNAQRRADPDNVGFALGKKWREDLELVDQQSFIGCLSEGECGLIGGPGWLPERCRLPC
jgi:hypothetical protein